MANKNEQVDIEFNFRDEGFKDVIDRIQDMSDHLGDVQGELRSLSDAGRGSAQEVQKAFLQMIRVQEKAIKDTDYGHMFSGAMDQIKAIENELPKLGKLAEEVQSARDKHEKKSNDASLKLLHDKEAAYREAFNSIKKMQSGVAKDLKSQSEEVKQVFVKDREKLNKFMSEELPTNLGSGIGESIKSALSGGDLQGVISGITSAGGNVARAGFGKWRQGRKEKKLQAKMAGQPAGGKMGGVAKKLGTVARALGGVMAAVGGIAMVVKLLMDAEAQTKELNKELTSSVSLLRLGGGNLADATSRMVELRESATDFATNVRLGLEPKQHYSVIKALEEHDARLSKLASHYQSWGDMAKDIVTEVRYASLNLGTSMEEVAGFMGDLQSIHAMSLPRIKDSLTMITDEAEESGMATKKFFGAVSQISGQMDLYNFKLGDTVTLMSELSQYMDPENAKEFATSLTTGFKEKGPLERMKSMLLSTGGSFQKASEMITSSVEDWIDSMDPKKIKTAQKALEGMGIDTGDGGPKAMMKAFQKMSAKQMSQLGGKMEEQFGAKAGAKFLDAVQASRKAGSNRMLDRIDASKYMGPIEQMGIKLKQLEEARLAEGKDSILALSDAVAENYAGLNQKEFKRYKRVYRDMLKDVQAKGGKEAIEEIVQKLREKSDKALEDMGLKKSTQESAAERQVDATQSVANILQYLIYDILNTIGKYTSGIYGFIAGRFGSDEDARKAELSNRVMEKRSKVTALKRMQQEAKDPRRKKELDTKIKAAEQDYKRAKGEFDFFKENRDHLYTQKGAERGGAGTTRKKMDAMRKRGFSGSYQQYLDLQQEAQKEAGRYGSVSLDGGQAVHRIGGKTVSKKEFHKARAKREQQLLDEAISKRKLDEKKGEIQEEILADMKKDGADLASAGDYTNRILEKRGIKLNSEAHKEFQASMQRAFVKAKDVDELTKGGFSRKEASIIADEIAAGNKFTKERAKELGLEWSAARQKTATNVGSFGSAVPEGGDAKILSRGVPTASLKPGDMVVDRDSLAKTITGRPGQFIPDFMNAVSGGRGGGGGMVMHNTFNINGGNTQEVENTVLRVLDMAERKRNGES